MATIYGHETTTVCLPHEKRAGIANPRTLIVKILSKREARAFQKAIETANALETAEAIDNAIDAELAKVVVGWKNIDGEFSIQALSDKFMMGEFGTLIANIPYASAISEDDQKKSVSPA